MDFATCDELYENFPKEPDATYCSSIFDGFLCWAPLLASQLVSQHCPAVRLSDPTQFAYRRCGTDGKWLDKNGKYENPLGWTNYTPCFPPVVQSLFYKVYEDDDAQMKFQIAEHTRIIEIVGFSISFILLTISTFILHYYKSLRNLRTLIHKNLFCAMNAQVVVRLILYIDQAVTRFGDSITNPNLDAPSMIEQTPSLCISLYILLEFFNCGMFMWMLNEGYYLNTLITANVLKDNSSYKYFWIFGWVVPLVITAAWAVVSYIHYATHTTLGCWYGYNFHPFFWVVQGPRLSVSLINGCFLLNIMRVLVMKLQQDNSTDVEKARKAVKAALVLLPLLGITNILSMFEGPVSGPIWAFALWCYITHFLRSFQGTFLAIIYCFCNGEVQAVLSKSFTNRLIIFRYRHPRIARWFGFRPRIRRFPRGVGTVGLGRPRDGPGPSGMGAGDMQMKPLQTWTPRSQRNATEQQNVNMSETEFAGSSADYRTARQPQVYQQDVRITIEDEPRPSTSNDYTASRAI